jgi:hypothetical protein
MIFFCSAGVKPKSSAEMAPAPPLVVPWWLSESAASTFSRVTFSWEGVDVILGGLTKLDLTVGLRGGDGRRRENKMACSRVSLSEIPLGERGEGGGEAVGEEEEEGQERERKGEEHNGINGSYVT